MRGPYWSLKNKLEDVKSALDRGQNTSARMAGHELAIRLSHLTTTLRFQTMGNELASTLKQNNLPLQETFSHFEEALNRLLLLLKDKQNSRAAEVQHRLFELLETLSKLDA